MPLMDPPWRSRGRWHTSTAILLVREPDREDLHVLQVAKLQMCTYRWGIGNIRKRTIHYWLLYMLLGNIWAANLSLPDLEVEPKTGVRPRRALMKRTRVCPYWYMLRNLEYLGRWKTFHWGGSKEFRRKPSHGKEKVKLFTQIENHISIYIISA